MAKILVFQHVPHEPLGALDARIRDRRHRIRYVNFSRDPGANPNVTGYQALIVLGGPMNVDEADRCPHIAAEVRAIREALALEIPILGICLGAQLLAAALGARVYPAEEREIGWSTLVPTARGRTDPVIGAFGERERVFQWHGYTFDLPAGGDLLVTGEACANQAFRHGPRAYGFQFHLEADRALIHRWLNLPDHAAEVCAFGGPERVSAIREETERHIDQSLALGERVFDAFLDLLPSIRRRLVAPSR